MTHILGRILGMAVSMSAAFTLTANANELCSADWNSVVEKAKQEGSLRIYTSLLPSIVGRVADGFKNTYPGLDVQIVRNTTGATIAKLDQEREAKLDGADVAVHTDLGWFLARSKAGELRVPSGPSKEKWPADFAREDGAIIVVSVDPIVIAYNNTMPNPPKNYPDLLDADLAGRLALTEVISPSAVAFYNLLEKSYGEEFLHKLKEQKPRFYNGTAPATQAVASGEVLVNAFTVPSVVLALKKDGAPIDFVVPDPGIAAAFVGAMLGSAGRPNAACLFMDYMTSVDGQTLMHADGGSASPYPDIKNALPMDTLDVFDATKFPAEVINEYRKRWETIFQ